MVTYRPPKNPWLEQRRRERRKAQQEWNREHTPPEIIAARKAVARALRSGKLKRTRCVDRGVDCKAWPTTFHHTHGYDKAHRLTGVWVCWPCHWRRHQEERRQEVKEALQEQAEALQNSPGVVVIED